ncbi:MAG: tryptophan synthase subunit alpha [Bryobacteraceae bacterium]|nr:tryptophan synthase subunit alpha [Bryobacteraceae bacterium]MDW8377891.1 tryptophan synthase subunit alpha [Bryobacterales bacterium]
MRIRSLFERKRQQGRPALIAYLTAGDPTPEHTPRLAAALERGGVDLIELGVPFSDPIADGPVIQAASERSLAAGTTLPLVLEMAEEIRKHSEIPLLLFSYLNPVLRYGSAALARDAKKSGIDGVLLTDLSVEEAGSLAPEMRRAGLDTVFLASPTSPPRRLALVAEHSSGFVYLVSRTGVTGERESLSESIHELVASLRKITTLPLAVGFGISTPEQVAKVGALADGVVVGSAFVRLVERYASSSDLEGKLETFARSLSSAMPVRAGVPK